MELSAEGVEMFPYRAHFTEKRRKYALVKPKNTKTGL